MGMLNKQTNTTHIHLYNMLVNKAVASLAMAHVAVVSAEVTYSAFLVPFAGSSYNDWASVELIVNDNNVTGFGYINENLGPGFAPNDCVEKNGCGLHIHAGFSCK